MSCISFRKAKKFRFFSSDRLNDIVGEPREEVTRVSKILRDTEREKEKKSINHGERFFRFFSSTFFFSKVRYVITYINTVNYRLHADSYVALVVVKRQSDRSRSLK